MSTTSSISNASEKPSSAGSAKSKKGPKSKLGLVVSNLSPSSGGIEIESPGEALAAPMQELSLPEEVQQNLKISDFVILSELGAGNGGTVNLVKHTPTDKIMARKIIRVEPRPNTRKLIQRELQILSKCKSPYIVSFYGAAMDGGDVSVFMEYMDCGSLDTIYKSVDSVPEDVMGQITYAVLKGLMYLYENHKIVHRDIKPSNMLMNLKGEVKIADFGVSGQLENSKLNTFVGTSAYMSPERIQGSKYTVLSDVWSVGLMLLEIALGRFPFPPEGQSDDKIIGVFDLLEYIVNEPVPKLPEGKYSTEFEQFLEKCLIKNVERSDPSITDLSKRKSVRPTFSELLAGDPFVLRAEQEVGKVDMKGFAELVLVKQREKKSQTKP